MFRKLAFLNKIDNYLFSQHDSYLQFAKKAYTISDRNFLPHWDQKQFFHVNLPRNKDVKSIEKRRDAQKSAKNNYRVEESINIDQSRRLVKF